MMSFGKMIPVVLALLLAMGFAGVACGGDEDAVVEQVPGSQVVEDVAALPQPTAAVPESVGPVVVVDEPTAGGGETPVSPVTVGVWGTGEAVARNDAVRMVLVLEVAADGRDEAVGKIGAVFERLLDDAALSGIGGGEVDTGKAAVVFEGIEGGDGRYVAATEVVVDSDDIGAVVALLGKVYGYDDGVWAEVRSMELYVSEPFGAEREARRRAVADMRARAGSMAVGRVGGELEMREVVEWELPRWSTEETAPGEVAGVAGGGVGVEGGGLPVSAGTSTVRVEVWGGYSVER